MSYKFISGAGLSPPPKRSRRERAALARFRAEHATGRDRRGWPLRRDQQIQPKRQRSDP